MANNFESERPVQERSILDLQAEAAISDLSPDAASLVFFSDLDGTLTYGDNTIPPHVQNGILSAAKNGIITTIATGRPYSLVPQIIKDRLINPANTPMVTGGGGTFTKKDGEAGDIALTHEYLSDNDIDAILTLLHEPETAFVLYPQSDLEKEPALTLWHKKPEDMSVEASQLVNHYAQFADVYSTDTLPHDSLLEKVKADAPSLLTIIANDEEGLLKKLPDGINAALSSGGVFTMTREGVNKRSALEMVSQKIDIPSSNFIVAGNDVNDFPMLAHEEVLRSIYIGNADKLRDIHPNHDRIIEIGTPDQLGLFLHKLGNAFIRAAVN